MTQVHSRRTFLQALGASAALVACSSNTPKAGSAAGGGEVPKGPQPGAPQAGDVELPAGATMPTRPLGRTGVNVSVVGLGGFHMGFQKDEQESIRLVRHALDHGINFLDNCWDYNDGESERRMGLALQDGYRQKAFLMTKLDGRTRDAATKQLEQSLQRLKTDHIDLVQIHEVIRMSDPERVFGPDGAIEALVAAQKAGKLRFIGFTGHKDPSIHLAMLKAAQEHGFRFDTVQMPLNAMDVHFRSFQKDVLPVLEQQGIGVLGMKPMGSGLLLKSGAVTAMECLQYAMSLPTDVVITGCDTMGILEQALLAAYSHAPLGDEQKKALEAKTAPAAAQGEFERYKTSDIFDGTAKHPQWLEAAKI